MLLLAGEFNEICTVVRASFLRIARRAAKAQATMGEYLGRSWLSSISPMTGLHSTLEQQSGHDL